MSPTLNPTYNELLKSWARDGVVWGRCADEYIERQAEDESLAPAYDPSAGYDATIGRGGS